VLKSLGVLVIVAMIPLLASGNVASSAPNGSQTVLADEPPELGDWDWRIIIRIKGPGEVWNKKHDGDDSYHKCTVALCVWDLSNNDFAYDLSASEYSSKRGWKVRFEPHPRANGWGNSYFKGWVSQDGFGGCDSQASQDFHPDESSTCTVFTFEDGKRTIVTAIFEPGATGPRPAAPLTVSVTGRGAITTRPGNTVVCENYSSGRGKAAYRPTRVCTPHARPGSTLRLIARPAAGWRIGQWRAPCLNQRSPRQTTCDLPVGDKGTAVNVLFVRRRG
jgi:hypothetical protein